MSDGAPLLVIYDGDVLVPASPFWRKRMAETFEAGTKIQIVQHQERSSNSHRHYFAQVNEVWENLPEELAQEFPTAEHLRKYALIRTGFFDSHTLVCSSKAEALRVAAFIRPTDEYAIVNVSGCAVERFTAKSQSMKAMGAKEFQRSKEDVLGFIAKLIGTTRADLAQNTEAAA